MRKNTKVCFKDIKNEALQLEGEMTTEPSEGLLEAGLRQVRAQGVISGNEGNMVTWRSNMEAALHAMQQQLSEMQETMMRGVGQPAGPGWHYEFTRDGRPICRVCGTAGHIARNCRQKNNPSQEPNRTNFPPSQHPN